MSMTLKKGQKAFKPKFPPRRAAGSQPSSARPSVERQSQTPVPPSRPAEPIFIPDNDDSDLPTEAPAAQSTPQSSILESPASSAQQQTLRSATTSTTSAENTLKRKAGIESDPDVTQKRARSDASQPSKDVELIRRETGSGDARSILIEGVSTTNVGSNQPQQALLSSAIRNQTIHDTLSSQPPAPQASQASQVETRAPPAVKATSHSMTADPTPAIQARAHADPTSIQGVNNPSVNETTHVRFAGRSTTATDMQATIHVEEETISRQTTPEVRQDNPSSIYPDPELSGISLARAGGGGSSSGILMSTAMNADGTTLGQAVNSAALNPDGTPASDLVPAIGLNPDGTSRVEQGQPLKAKEKVPKKRRRVLLPEGDDVRPTIEMRLTRVRQTEGGSKRGRKKKEGNKTKKKRGETPEGAEDEIIDRAAMKMADLCKDLKIGEKSSRHEQMKLQELAAKAKTKEKRLAKKRAAERAARGEDPEGADGPEREGENPQRETAAATPEPESARGGGIRYMLVDGVLVVDPRSLEVRRDDSARKGGKKDWAEKIKETKVRQENEFSTLVTSGSYMKREPAQMWSDADTDLFYKGLTMFGPNFEMIAKMFPSRNRRQIKLKHAVEERDNPWKIDRIEKGEKIPIDWDLFQEHCSEKLVEVEEIEAELQAYADEEKRMEEIMRKERLAADEQKRATIRKGTDAARRALDNMSDDDGDGNDKSQSGRREASAAPKGKKKAGQSKRANKSLGQQDADNYTVVARIA